MKKLILCLTMVFATVSTSHADTITLERAKQIAQRQMQKSPNGLRSADELILSKTEYISATMLRSGNEETVAYYVFNREKDAGFVIVAGDDRLNEVIGYSYSGSFRTDNMPSNLAYWMNGYKEILAAVIDGTAAVNTDTSASNLRASKTSLLDMKNIRWDQGSPWNVNTPKINGQHPPIGCVATAMGQIMAYYNWPTEAEGAFTRYIINSSTMSLTPGESHDFTGHKYDWAEINKYAKSDTYEAAGKMIVGKFMIDVANAFNMQFGLNGSGTYDNDALHAMINHFRYRRDARIEIRAMHSEAFWRAMLNRELDANRPIFYTGGGKSGGHAFICDGYAEDGKYHFNWGWNGYGNGYYELINLVPSETGAGAGTGNFTQNQKIIVDLTPARNLNDRGQEPTPRLVLGYYGADKQQFRAINTNAELQLISFLTPQMSYKVRASARLLCYDPEGNIVERLSTPIESSSERFFLFAMYRGSRIPLDKYELNKEYTYKCFYKIEGSDLWVQAMPHPMQTAEIKIKRTSNSLCEIQHMPLGSATDITPILPEATAAQVIKIFPTVATDLIHIELPVSASGTASLINVQGKIIRNIQIAESNQTSIQVGDLPPGTYFVRFASTTARFVIR